MISTPSNRGGTGIDDIQVSVGGVPKHIGTRVENNLVAIGQIEDNGSVDDRTIGGESYRVSNFIGPVNGYGRQRKNIRLIAADDAVAGESNVAVVFAETDDSIVGKIATNSPLGGITYVPSPPIDIGRPAWPPFGPK